MFSLSRPLGRLPFLAGLTIINSVILLAVVAALTFQPSGGGHLAVLVVVGALQFVWLSLHARRFADAGRGSFWPVMAGLACFGSFAFAYLLMAALWSSPAVQEEAFRTGGTLAGGQVLRHLETNALVLETGRVITSWIGAAGALVLSGLALTGMGLVAAMSGIFSLIAVVLPGGRSPQRLLHGGGLVGPVSLRDKAERLVRGLTGPRKERRG